MIDFEKIFQESCNRVTSEESSGSRNDLFFDVFYEKFIGSSPAIAEKFSGVDLEAQKEMVRQSLTHLLELFATKSIPVRLREVARMHDREHADIPPELYLIWMRCLLETVQEFDPEFDDDVELAWRLVCSQGIAYMTFMYDR